MKFVEASKKILEENNNVPMSANEIWEKIKNIVVTKGKTPQATLNVILLGQSVNSPLGKFTQKNREIFKIIGENPMKFYLAKYVPKSIKESLVDSGFITIDKLKEILAKNNINIEI